MARQFGNMEPNTELLSPWSSGSAWSFNPKAIAVATPKRADYLSSSDNWRHQKTQGDGRISRIQLLTVLLLVISFGLAAAIVAMLMS
jgi:hypothetical protein